MDSVNLGKISVPVITPQKGVDYYTEEEKQELITTVTTNVNAIITPQEQARQTNETARIQAEVVRQSQEGTRQSQESDRQQNETARQTAETARNSAEATRKSNETTRQNNESTRNTTFNTKMRAVDAAIADIQDKTAAYNANATSKTNDFNSNAETKTTAFNSNASSKTTDFNNNATAKTNAFDEHVEEFQAQINNKVDKVTGKGLSTEDYTTEEKTKLASLENYDDTEITGRVSGIETEQTEQNTLIETLQTEVTELQQETEDLRNSSYKVSGTGEYVTLDKTSKNKFVEFDVSGNRKQETRSGKNVLNINATPTSQNISSATIDGSKLTLVKGTSNAYTRYVVPITLEANTDYILTGKVTLTVNESDGSTQLMIRPSATGGTAIYSKSLEKTTNEQTVNVTFNSGENTSMYFWFYLDAGNDGSTARTGVYTDFMIRKASITDDTYEEYGVMPSPDYPSEVKGVGDDVNLFDGEWTSGGVSVNFIPVVAGQSYIYSEQDVGTTMNYRFYETMESTPLTDVWKAARAAYVPESNGYIKLYKTTSSKIKCKLQKGTVVTTYSPYGCGNAEIETSNKNWFDAEQIVKDSNNPSRILIEGDYIKYFTGGVPVILKPKIIKENTAYTFKLIMKSGVETTSTIAFVAEYTDGTRTTLFNIIRNDTNEFKAVFSTDPTKTLDAIKSNWNASKSAYIKIDGSMIIEGKYTAQTLPDYIERQEQTYNMPCQKPMLDETDYFDWENEEEVHGWNEVTLDGSTADYSSQVSGDFLRVTYTPFSDLSLVKLKTPYISNKLQELSPRVTSDVEGIANTSATDVNRCFIYIRTDRLEEASTAGFRAWLAENPITIAYQLATPERLPFTEAQKEVAEEIAKAKSYDEQTNIYSTDEVSPNYNITAVANANDVIDEVKTAIVALGGVI